MTSAEDRIRATAEKIDAHPECEGVDVLDPDGPHDGWALEATLDTQACPPAIAQFWAGAQLWCKCARPRGRGFHIVVTA